eukprot:TRINITY_DN599_c0_g1_i1.p1 TRINITY_DN599_c0_g1~~TRINITY_DN599_c0_g1_i1.p1  ORF type:complete len:111 (+),score=43.59 TRINITY_DN599_c0_g1_i1:272-604(+)
MPIAQTSGPQQSLSSASASGATSVPINYMNRINIQQMQSFSSTASGASVSASASASSVTNNTKDLSISKEKECLPQRIEKIEEEQNTEEAEQIETNANVVTGDDDSEDQK